MKNLIALFLLITLISSCTTEPVVDKDAESKAIHKVVVSMFEAIPENDVDKLKANLCDEFFAYDMAQVMKFEDLVNAMASLPQMGFTDVSYTVKPVESFIFNENAVACFRTIATAKMGDQDIKMEFDESYLMIKTEEGWKIRFFHSTQLPPPAPEEDVVE